MEPDINWSEYIDISRGSFICARTSWNALGTDAISSNICAHIAVCATDGFARPRWSVTLCPSLNISANFIFEYTAIDRNFSTSSPAPSAAAWYPRAVSRTSLMDSYLPSQEERLNNAVDNSLRLAALPCAEACVDGRKPARDASRRESADGAVRGGAPKLGADWL